MLKLSLMLIKFKVDRLNAEISAFSSGDLNKYEFLTRKNLKYKPNVCMFLSCHVRVSE